MNLRAIAMVARANASRRTGSLLLLVLLVAVVGAVVLASAAGARRSATALDRFLDATDQEDAAVYVMGLDSSDAPRVLGAVPGVEAVSSAEHYLAQPTTEDGLSFNFSIAASADPGFGADISRLLVRDGRLPAPDRSDEVVLNGPAAELLGLGAGDELEVATMSPAAFERLVSGDAGVELDGPVIPLQVVGVVQVGADLQGSAQQSQPLAFASPAFRAAYGDAVASSGSWSSVSVSDASALDGLRAAAASSPQSSVIPVGEGWVDTTRSAIAVVVIALLVFAVIALVAGAFAVGQAVSRQLSAETGAVVVGRALGLTRAERVVAAGLPALVAGTVGSAVAVVVAAASSGLFPLAVARAAEPDPGMRIDPVVLGPGWLVLVLALAGWTALAARHRDVVVVSPGPERGGRTIAGVVGVGSAVAPRLGVRLALDRGRGRSSVPTRSALGGVTAGVAGVVAAVVFLASLHGALVSPADFGWTWSARPDVSSEPFETVQALAEDPDVAAAGGVFSGEGRLDGATVPVQTFFSASGSLGPPVIEGRLPSGTAEVALGASALESAGVSVGDHVSLAGPDGPASRFEVVGVVVGSQITDYPDLGRIAVIAPEAAMQMVGATDLASMDGSFLGGNVLLAYREGVDPSAVERRLSRTYPLDFPAYSHPTPPGRLLNMDDMTPLLVGLAGFFALLGTVGLVHVLVVSTRRRAPEFGVLSALGLVRSQLRSIVWFQALTLIAVGLVVGVPLGIVVGRVAWRAAIGDIGMIVSPSSPWVTLAALSAVAVAATWLIALVPGAWASRVRPAEQLRTE